MSGRSDSGALGSEKDLGWPSSLQGAQISTGAATPRKRALATGQSTGLAIAKRRACVRARARGAHVPGLWRPLLPASRARCEGSWESGAGVGLPAAAGPLPGTGLGRPERGNRRELSCLWSAPGHAEGRAPSGRGRARGGGGGRGARRTRRGMRRRARAPPSSRASGPRGTSARAPAGLGGGGSHGAGRTARAAGRARGCELVWRCGNRGFPARPGHTAVNASGPVRMLAWGTAVGHSWVVQKRQRGPLFMSCPSVQTCPGEAWSGAAPPVLATASHTLI